MVDPDRRPDIDDLFDDLLATVRDKLLVAYQRGERAGRAAAKEAILLAVGRDEDEGRLVYIAEPKRNIVGNTPTKAPRGLVAKAIREVLKADPGLPISEIEARVIAAYPVISPKTIGNELRRQEGLEYRREGKYSWFLIEEPKKKSSMLSIEDLLSSYPKGGESE